MWTSDAIWRHRSGLTLTPVKASCRQATGHCLIQYWFMMTETLLHSFESNSTKILKIVFTKTCLKTKHSKSQPHLLQASALNMPGYHWCQKHWFRHTATWLKGNLTFLSFSEPFRSPTLLDLDSRGFAPFTSGTLGSINVNSTSELPFPPDCVTTVIRPFTGFHAFVVTYNLLEDSYSREPKQLAPHMWRPTTSALLTPRLRPRMVIRVPPDIGPWLGEIPDILGLSSSSRVKSTWLLVRLLLSSGAMRAKGAKARFFIPFSWMIAWSLIPAFSHCSCNLVKSDKDECLRLPSLPGSDSCVWLIFFRPNIGDFRFARGECGRKVSLILPKVPPLWPESLSESRDKWLWCRAAPCLDTQAS